MNMCDKILGYIQKHGSITPDECYDAFHSQKLATRSSELIDRGVPIEKAWVYKKLPNGRKKKLHKVYTLKREGIRIGSEMVHGKERRNECVWGWKR